MKWRKWKLQVIFLLSVFSLAIAWWENKGQPFSASGWERHQIGERFAHDVSVGDLNGDRNLDVVMFRKDSPRQLTWFEAPNDPRQSWTRHKIDTPPGEGLDLGDLDGDGDLVLRREQTGMQMQAVVNSGINIRLY